MPAQLEGRRSSTYMFITDDTGDLLVAVNDMEICKEINPAFLESRLDFINGAAICLLDANLEPETMAWIGEHVTAPLFGDTVSTVKAHRFDTILNKMTVLKPNDLEASVLTGIGIADQYSAGAAAKTLLDRGAKNVFISLGANGILCARHENDEYSFKHVPPYRTEIATANGAGEPAWQPSPGASSITPIEILKKSAKSRRQHPALRSNAQKQCPISPWNSIRKKMSGEIEPLLDEVRTA